jgi:hypothetical protein
MSAHPDVAQLPLSPAATAFVASASKELSEQQAMNEALEAQIQEGLQKLLRVISYPRILQCIACTAFALLLDFSAASTSPIANDN